MSTAPPSQGLARPSRLDRCAYLPRARARGQARSTAWLTLLFCVGVHTLGAPPLAAQAMDDAEREALEGDLFGGGSDDATRDDEGSDGEEADGASRALEEELFGGEDEGDEVIVRSSAQGDGGAAASARMAQALEEADQELALGGFLFMQLNDQVSEGGGLDAHRLSAPNLFDLYLDARPNNRLRAYVRGRLLYDPSRSASQGGAQPQQDAMGGMDAAAPGAGLGLDPGLATNQTLRAQLDQLWVKFDVGRKVYVTVGRQRIRWGSGRFWNPTDFLNATQINPIALFDQRLGVDLIKLHIPLERLGWNLYALGLMGEASNPRDVGGALRAELVFGPAELALSGVVRRQTAPGPQPLEPFYSPTQEWPQEGAPLRLGADLSTALGPFEVHVEGALTRGDVQPFYSGELVLEFPGFELPEDRSRRDEWIAQVSVSADITLQYSDEDSVILGAEYFYNDAGYESADLYLWLALQGGLRPLYLGRHYAAIALLIPSPGPLNDSTFTVSAVGNLSDGSFLSRLDYSLRALDDLTLNVYVMRFFGSAGEFKFSAELPAVPGVSDAPTRIAAPSLGLGAGLRLSF